MTDWREPLEQKADELFLETMEDLRKRSDLRAPKYDMVQSAGLVRRLIVDGRRLADEVNRGPRLPIRFFVGSMWVCVKATPPPIWGQGPWLDPLLVELKDWDFTQQLTASGAPAPDMGGPPRPRSRDEFLRYAPFASAAKEDGSDTEATVLDIITMYANQLGGVHWDPAKVKHPLLRELLAIDEAYLRQTMVAIGRTVYRALEPLAYYVILSQREHPFGLRQHAR